MTSTVASPSRPEPELAAVLRTAPAPPRGALRVEGPGVGLEQAGEVELGHFLSRALEFEVEAGASPGGGTLRGE